ncbi:MAG: hypothetical protein HQ478_03935 [Chloroflexi bacterium]|nr:hypothetical protein [Chloroflexota bacterium]
MIDQTPDLNIISTRLNRPLVLTVMAVALLLLVLTGPTSARADSHVEIINATAVSEFPDGIRFSLEVESDLKIDEVAVRFKIAGESSSQYNYLDLDEMGAGSSKAMLVSGEYFLRKSTRATYSPPGTIVEYFFEITDVNGVTEVTDPQQLIYMDARYEWDEVTIGPVTTFFHGPVKVRATSMSQVAVDTLDNMGPLLGAETVTPLRIIMYNNNAEMIGALSSRSSAISSELITEGQAFGQQNVVLLLGNGRRAGGTISHELTHVLVQRATAGSALSVPLWLNEGLAEFGNVDPSLSYDRYLEWAVDTGRTTPFESLTVFPGDPNLNLVAYGQARSVVEFMVDEFGRDKMTELMATVDGGTIFDLALRRTYDMSTRELDDLWRKEVGAAPLADRSEIADSSATTPTHEPTVKPVGLLTLDSVAAAGSSDANKSVETEPTEDPKDAIVASPAPEATAESPQATGTSGGCSAPSRSGAPLEASSAALTILPLLGLGWMAAKAVRKRR